MKLVEDTKAERLITLTFTEAELREIQQYASYYSASASATAATKRLESNLKNLNLGNRRDWDKLFL